jgi:hypothetical protein
MLRSTRYGEGKLVSVDVYFGWTLPHKAPAGGLSPMRGTRLTSVAGVSAKL